MKKKILIISGEAWRDESNGGNVLSNLFGPLQNEYEFAQIYTNPALPSNKICTRYFHLSEAEMLHSVIKRKPFGRILDKSDYFDSTNNIQSLVFNSNATSLVKKYFINFLYFVQNLFWSISIWKTKDLNDFIVDYKPDLIFAPLYSGIFIHRIDRFASEITHKKIVSYVSDDVLTFKQFSVSPFFWINRVLLRKNVIETSKLYSLLYTMTQEQLEEYQPVLKVPMKVLKKTGVFEIQPLYSNEKEGPFIISYGGNLIYNRYKTLAKLAEAIKIVNKEKTHFILHIYTQTPIILEFKKLLDDGKNTFLKGKVTMKELEQVYANSDLVLHVESFDLKQRLLTRLSFSTKIIDLLNSGRSVMAICWDKSSPYKYLQSEDAALLVSNTNDIEMELRKIIDNPTILIKYADKAWQCGVKNHSRKNVIADFKNDLESLIS